MANLLLQPLPELVKPDYNTYRFTDQIYKVIRFNSTAPRFASGESKKRKGNENKLSQSISRSKRTMLELGLCNDWTYFATFTLDGHKHDRYDLINWHKSFLQWLRDQRKKYIKAGHEFKIDFALVPELHQDGAWHCHGFFSDLSPVLVSFADERAAGMDVPDKLIKGGYLDWPDYHKKFGFCSFGKIRDKAAASFYVTKYCSKSLDENGVPVGRHSIWHSDGLNRATLHGDIYGRCAYLDQFLTNHYDFCSTGMTHVKDGLSWDFALEYMEVQPLEPLEFSTIEDDPEVDQYVEYTQLGMDYYS